MEVLKCIGYIIIAIICSGCTLEKIYRTILMVEDIMKLEDLTGKKYKAGRRFDF